MARHALMIKRAYLPADDKDGIRVLVDRLWPRGLSKRRAAVVVWLKEIAPSNTLRTWFDHDPAKWEEFKVRYRVELEGNAIEVQHLRDIVSTGDVTLVYASKDETHNNATALTEYLGGGQKR